MNELGEVSVTEHNVGVRKRIRNNERHRRERAKVLR